MCHDLLIIFFKLASQTCLELDWSNLNEKVEEILGNYNDFHYIIENFRNKFREVYTYHDICMHWYNILKTVRSVTYE